MILMEVYWLKYVPFSWSTWTCACLPNKMTIFFTRCMRMVKVWAMWRTKIISTLRKLMKSKRLTWVYRSLMRSFAATSLLISKHTVKHMKCIMMIAYFLWMKVKVQEKMKMPLFIQLVLFGFPRVNRHKLTGDALADVIKLIDLHCIPRPNFIVTR